MTVVEKVEQIATNTGWEVKDNGKYLSFQMFSPAGQDCNIEANISGDTDDEKFESIKKEVRDFVDGFDVSTETYLWLDHFGHGQNGAPYDMKDCYEDMVYYLKKAEELSEALENETL